MAVVTFDLVRPGDDTPAKEGSILVELVGADQRRVTGVLEDDTVVVGTFTPQVDAAGHAEVDLVPNSLIEPAGTVYKVTVVVDDERTVAAITVLDIGSPRAWTTLTTEFPGDPLPNTALAAHVDSTTAHPAEAITLDTPPGMAAEDVQAGIEELFGTIGSVGDDLAAESEARATADSDDADALAAAVLALEAADDTETAARQAADEQLVPVSALGVTVATIDPVTGKVYANQIPAQSLFNITVVANQAAMLALDADVNDIAVRDDTGAWFLLEAEPASVLGNWSELPAAVGVSAVNGRTGAVSGLAEQSALDTEAATRAAADTQEAADRAAADLLRMLKSANLSDVADAAAARGNLGLGTAALVAATDFAPATPTVGAALATTGTVTLDVAALNGTDQTITATGNITFASSNRAAGRTLSLKLSAGASTRTLSFPAWHFVGNSAPTSIASGKVGILTVKFYDTTDAAAVAAWAVEA